jgi:O-antigen ligase
LYQDEVLEFLENLQANLSNLTGLNIRLVNQEGYGLTSGRDKLWGMHMSMVDEHPFFGIGYPLPLDDYGWADGDAITESGLTSILARYGWIGVVLFFIPALAILWKLIFSSNLGYKPLKIELFIYFAILINCFYNGLLQNPYGEGAFSWTFLLAFYNLLNHTSSRVLQQINATSLNTIPRESLSKSRKQSNRIQ